MHIENARAALQYALDQLDYCVDGPEATYTARTDRFIQAKPTLPTLGAAGSSFHDPSFLSRILRVSDGTAHPGRSVHVPSNTHLAAWNADSSRFYVVGSEGPVIYGYDPQTFTAYPIDVIASQCEPTYSRSNPDLLFTVGGSQTRTVKRYELGEQSYTDILDLDTLGLPNLVEPRTYVGGIVSAGSPETLAVFFGGTGQDHHYLVAIINLDGTVAHLINTRTLFNIDLHSIGRDLSGRYVTLYPVGQHPCSTIVWDLTAQTFTNITVSPYGHDALGYGVQVNADVASGLYDAAQWCHRSLATPNNPTNLIEPVLRPVEVYLADHTSWNHAKPDQAMPVISSTYRTPGNTVAWRPWDDEILGIATTPGGPVYRFAHHRSLVSTFWSQPITHVAPNGQAAIFHSNWEGTLGPDTNEGGLRNDAFLVELR